MKTIKLRLSIAFACFAFWVHAQPPGGDRGAYDDYEASRNKERWTQTVLKSELEKESSLKTANEDLQRKLEATEAEKSVLQKQANAKAAEIRSLQKQRSADVNKIEQLEREKQFYEQQIRFKDDEILKYKTEAETKSHLLDSISFVISDLRRELELAQMRIEEYERLRKVFSNMHIEVSAFPAKDKNDRNETRRFNKWKYTVNEMTITPINPSFLVPAGVYSLEVLDGQGNRLYHGEGDRTYEKKFHYNGGKEIVLFSVYGSKYDAASNEYFYARITYLDRAIDPPILFHVTNVRFQVKYKKGY